MKQYVFKCIHTHDIDHTVTIKKGYYAGNQGIDHYTRNKKDAEIFDESSAKIAEHFQELCGTAKFWEKIEIK